MVQPGLKIRIKLLMQGDIPGCLLWQPLWESSCIASGFCALHTGESHFGIMFQTGKLMLCTCSKVFGASEKLFANAKLAMKVTVCMCAEGCYIKPRNVVRWSR